jgi:hypothetical protein
MLVYSYTLLYIDGAMAASFSRPAAEAGSEKLF